MTHLWINKEGDPGDDDKQAGGQVVGHHVEGPLPRQHQLQQVGGRGFVVKFQCNNNKTLCK